MNKLSQLRAWLKDTPSYYTGPEHPIAPPSARQQELNDAVTQENKRAIVKYGTEVRRNDMSYFYRGSGMIIAFMVLFIAGVAYATLR